MPFALFLVTLGGFLIASGYYIYCTFFGARLLSRCDVPGETAFDVEPQMNPMRITARSVPGRADAAADLRLELEREGSWQWSRQVRLPITGDEIMVEHIRVDRPGRYRLKAFGGGSAGGASVTVQMRVHEPRASVYVLAGSMLAGGFVSLLVLLV
ncbi:MAG: hypothetical protein K2X67_03900 [Burkholderiales bacterium]|nr:hypothetical protein [Burkholderiales bacterium]